MPIRGENGSLGVKLVFGAEMVVMKEVYGDGQVMMMTLRGVFIFIFALRWCDGFGIMKFI